MRIKIDLKTNDVKAPIQSKLLGQIHDSAHKVELSQKKANKKNLNLQ